MCTSFSFLPTKFVFEVKYDLSAFPQSSCWFKCKIKRYFSALVIDILFGNTTLSRVFTSTMNLNNKQFSKRNAFPHFTVVYRISSMPMNSP